MRALKPRVVRPGKVRAKFPFEIIHVIAFMVNSITKSLFCVKHLTLTNFSNKQCNFLHSQKILISIAERDPYRYSTQT
jgi:hypothetical protein